MSTSSDFDLGVTRPVDEGLPVVRFEEACVADAMHPGVLTCPRDATLRLVARMMAAYRVHCVVVFDDGREEERALWGVVSDLDLAAGLVEGDVDSTTAGQAAATSVVTVASDEPLRRAAQLMTENDATHLVVVDPSSGLPVGVLSTLDLARVAAASGLR